MPDDIYKVYERPFRVKSNWMNQTGERRVERLDRRIAHNGLP